MLQMEISNEHGYGGNFEEIANCSKNGQKTKIQRDKGKKYCQQEIL